MGGMLRVSNGLCDHYYHLFILPHHKYIDLFASTRAVRLFLRARAVIRAASTLEITHGEQRALRKFSANWKLSIIKTLFCAK